ncbi:MAG: hypothetical protein AAB590_03035 [Patescibacteria group bacterium]|mgnify:CR=1 FL=1
MEQINNYIGYGGFVIFLAFYIVWVIKYFAYWKQLKKALFEANTPWYRSYEQLRGEIKRDFVHGYYEMWLSIIRTTWNLCFMRTDNPSIAKPLRGIRRLFLIFFIFPFVLAFVMIVLALFLG